MKFLIILILQSLIAMDAKLTHNRQALRPACQNNLQTKRIVIVGAGMAGLTAASELLKKGFKDVVILEGNDRFGGRIHTKPQNTGGVLENGAQWIHGVKGNPIYDIAKKKDLLYKWMAGEYEKYHNKDWAFRTPDGQEVPDSVVTKTFDIIDKIFEQAEDLIDSLDTRGIVKLIGGDALKRLKVKERIEKKANILKSYEKAMHGGGEHSAADKKQGPEVSIGAYVRKSFTRILNKLKPTAEMRRWMESLYGWRMLMENTESACPSLDDVSFMAWNDYYLPPGDSDVELGAKGYAGILETIMANIPQSAIRLNTHVEKIQWKNADNTVKIIASGGQTFTADNVIVTSSLGYLKKNHRALFDPALPAKKSNSIDALGFGTLDKIFLFFDAKMNEVDFLWHSADTYFPQLNGQKYTPSWYRGLYIFFPILQQPKVMVGFISGEEAKATEASVSDSEMLEICHQLLQQFSGDDEFPRPNQILRTKWFSDKYANGSYSYRKVGSSVEDSKNLADPLKNNQIPVLLFAGEATHPDMFSTTHGAFKSGQREAERLSKYYCR